LLVDALFHFAHGFVVAWISEFSVIDTYALILIRVGMRYVHCDPMKMLRYNYLNNLIKNELILIVFGTWNPEEI